MKTTPCRKCSALAVLAGSYAITKGDRAGESWNIYWCDKCKAYTVVRTGR